MQGAVNGIEVKPETKQQILPEDACLLGCSVCAKSDDAVTQKVPSLSLE
jgi:hypothetical protein